MRECRPAYHRCVRASLHLIVAGACLRGLNDGRGRTLEREPSTPHFGPLSVHSLTSVLLYTNFEPQARISQPTPQQHVSVAQGSGDAAMPPPLDSLVDGVYQSLDGAAARSLPGYADLYGQGIKVMSKA